MEKLIVTNPFDNTILSELEKDNTESIKNKYSLLKSGFVNWKSCPVKRRIEIIDEFRKKVFDNIGTLSALLTKEMGKPLYESKKEIEDSLKRVQFFIDNSEKWLEKETLSSSNYAEEFVVYEPLGVTAVISAWNYPYIVGLNIFIPALIAGNSVAYKPSEYSTLTGIEIAKLLYESGLPQYSFQVIIGDGEIGKSLLELPIDGIFFTGTYITGVNIAKQVADRLIFTQLELGGKDPLYITEQIESIETIVKLAVDGTFYNNGQSCCAVKRIYIHESIYDKFVEQFKKQVEELVLGNPLLPETQVGPLTRKEQADILDSQIADALNKGAKVLTGGKRKNDTNFYLPTIVIDVNHKMRIMREESFGPIVTVMKVINDDEAIALMKDSEFGLTASVFCNDNNRAIKILNEMETGTVYLNCCDRVSDVSPWSGRKHSGLTPNHSYQTIRTFVQPKAYYIAKND